MNHTLRPPFDAETAVQKVRIAEDSWNSRDPAMAVLAYRTDSAWENRTEFLVGREAIVKFLTRNGPRNRNYRVVKEPWAFCEP